MNLKEIVLENTSSYKGKNFNLNLNATKLIKFLSEEIMSTELSEEQNEMMLCSYFGQEIKPLVKLCYENKKYLNEIAETNEPLLFEENLHDGIGEFLSLSKGFLSGVWGIVKTFGVNVWDKLANISFLKHLISEAISSPTVHAVSTGIGLFFAAGTLYSIWTIINRIRRNRKEKILTRKEREEYKKILIDNKKEIEEKMQKKGVKDFKIEAPKGTDTDEKEIKFTASV